MSTPADRSSQPAAPRSPSETATLAPGSPPAEAATLPPSPAPEAAIGGEPLDSVTVPGYEVLGLLGRGAMGVVYKARQMQADRLVALKMILHAEHAGADARARFQTEARAVARLQHPHIVQVHEVGEHKGVPFFSLEFCAGGSLDRKLNGTPLEAKAAAALVEKLARAVQAAHQAQIVHRDLSPGNVLLSADGMPKISDFGLAKKLDEQGRTQTGAILGTPSYMAPEQAGGRNKAVGPAADIYALGAILYECLTGRPPFKAATVMDTLIQVVRDEPVPPSQLQSTTPRDLETICLKCLHKEADRRYASALDLADDLGRFQLGEPIAARPVGRLERGWRWCRRNPALAAALAAVLLVFATGATVSNMLAVLAERRAEEAKRNEAAAVAARNDLEQSNDRLLTSTARSLLRPLAVQAEPGQWLPLPNDAEIEAIWELASSEEEGVRLRFIEEALRGPSQTRQLKDRAAYALHAAVGLDGARRGRVEQRLGEQLRRPGISPEQRLDVALVLAQFEIQDAALAGEVALVLTEALTTTTDSDAVQPLAEGLSAVVARLEPKEAAAVCGQAAAILRQAMSLILDPDQLRLLAQGLSVVAPRMEPKEAAAVCAQAATFLRRAMTPTTEAHALWQLAEGLSAVAAHMEPKEAAAVCGQAAATLRQAIAKTTNHSTVWQLARGLSALTTHMDLGPKEAEEAANLILTRPPSLPHPYPFGPISGHGLAAVLHREDTWRKGSPRCGLIASIGTLSDPRTLLLGTALLQPILAPPPLPPQTLVDLLKHPFCVGEARRLVLEQLSRHYRRPFTDPWDFVRFAREQKLDLDLTSPPRRPEVAAAARKP